MAAFRIPALSLTAAAMMVLAVGCGSSDDLSTGRSATTTSVPESVDPTESSIPPESAEPAETTDAMAALDAARQRWKEAELGDHSLLVEDDCGECGPDDRATSRVVTWGGQTYATGTAVTVDGVFDRIATAITEGREVAVTYDDETGYPSEVLFDSSQAAVDGATRLTISELREGLPGNEFSPTSFEDAARRWQATHPYAYEFFVTIACGGCPFEGRLYTKVVGDAVVEDWFESASGDETASGVTIDDIFRDLSELFDSDGGLVDGGVRFDGTAQYNAEYGYPNWIGLDLEIVEPQEWSRNLPPRLVYMIGRFTPLEADDYCAAVDRLFSMEPVERPDPEYARELQRLSEMAPANHREMWESLQTLVGEPFDYDNFNRAADVLDHTADTLTERCPALGRFVMNDDGYMTYLR